MSSLVVLVVVVLVVLVVLVAEWIPSTLPVTVIRECVIESRWESRPGVRGPRNQAPGRGLDFRV